jgi:hypothetical protein
MGARFEAERAKKYRRTYCRTTYFHIFHIFHILLDSSITTHTMIVSKGKKSLQKHIVLPSLNCSTFVSPSTANSLYGSFYISGSPTNRS